MATIGSDYSAHRQSIDELEKDYEAQKKKAKEREVTRDAKVERNVAAIVKKKNSEIERAVGAVKDRYESSRAQETRLAAQELEQHKKEVYNRSGRQANAVVSSATTDRDRAINAAEEAEKHYDKAVTDTESYYESKAAQQEKDAAREREAIVESYRKQIAEARESEADGGSTNEYREKLRKETEDAIRQAREEVQTERRQSRKLVDQYEYTIKDRAKKSDNLLDTRLHEKSLAVQDELHRSAEAARASREVELQPLREQIMESADLNRQAKTARSEARSETIRELEQDWNSKYTNQSLSHNLEKQKLRSDTADTERVYNDRMANFMREKNQKTAQLIGRQNADHRDQLSNVSQEYNRSLAEVKDQSVHEKERMELLRERERVRSEDSKNHALDRQASTYQTTLQNQRTAQQSQIKNLERVLNAKNTTDNVGEISSAAEQNVRRAVSNQYEKTFQAEADRNARSREHMQDNYGNQLREARHDNQSTTTQLNRQNLKEQGILTNTFVQHIADVEENKRQMLNLSNESNARSTEEMTRNHARVSDEMRRHFDELSAERGLENSSRVQEVLNQAEFDRRATRREFQSQTMDLTRSYEKKLSDQKISYEEALRDMKSKLDTQSRDSDRRLKQVLADQTRAADHRLAETEAQYKDREKLLARNHEEELDKVKKSNALLLSKKG